MVWKLGVLRVRQEIHSEDKLKISVVFPAYNEAENLYTAVTKITNALAEYLETYEIIIAEDGSTDGTEKKASELSEMIPTVRHLHSEKRLGRGKALKNAFQHSSGEILVYMDVDLATDVKQLKDLIYWIDKKGYDIAIGSRMLHESDVKRSVTRNLTSKAYNFIVRTVLGSEIKDHQCGFKAFQREALLQLLDEVCANHWFWDTEILVRAYRKGFRIKEIPVSWKSGRETKVRLLHDSLYMGWQIFLLWWHLKVQ